ncbi:hypothetical protein D3C81_674740 [compost metagenome]
MNNEINNDIQNNQGTLQFDTITVDEYVSKGEPRTVTAVHMDGSEVDLYQLDDKSIISKRRAVELCHQGILQGYVVGESKLGEEYLRGIPDGDRSNNLQELPKF